SYVRFLKEMGVFIYFEKEKLDTGNAASEMVLSILAAVAQEESRNISENIKWSQRKRFAEGIPKWSPTYGYKKENGIEFLIDDRTAPVVRRIFQEYAAGSSLPQIIRGLEEDQISSPNGKRWYPKVLSEILSNEKYVGDAMLQKSRTVDHLTHKRIRNDQTEVPSYYIRNHHTPIVDRKTFEIVQTVRSLKDRHKGSIQYPYYRRIRCPYCGDFLVRSCLPSRGRPGVWHCLSRDRQRECQQYYLYEAYLDQALREAYQSLDVEELRRFSKTFCKSRSVAAASASSAISMREQTETLTKIEYFFLESLVKEITFPHWECLMVFWKWGRSSSIHLNYRKNRDIPGHLEQQAMAQWLKETSIGDQGENPFDQNALHRLYYYGKDSSAREACAPSDPPKTSSQEDPDW
ncbi:MAG: recombinase family protein, partial [Eubacteriales bacterium]|nr:recombinase family protein [Eubacteriales bacterium]